MTDQHTPGPWVFVDAETKAVEGFAKQCVIRGAGKQIAAFSWQTPSKAFPSREESKANARLIAAAPDLLRAGEALLDAAERHIFGDECKAERDAFSAAIAKARGQ